MELEFNWIIVLILSSPIKTGLRRVDGNHQRLEAGLVAAAAAAAGAVGLAVLTVTA